MKTNSQYHWLAYMQFLDSALPVGAFSHSFGLETMVQRGMVKTAEELQTYIRSMLFGCWAPSDAMGIKAVYLCVAEGDWERLWRIDQMLHVQRTAGETRNGMQKMGKRLMELACSLYPQMEWEVWQEALSSGRCKGTHSVIHGYIAYRLGVSLRAAAEGYFYTCISTSLNSALRLMPLGQTKCQQLLALLLPLTGEAWNAVERMDPEDMYAGSPAADISMMKHETLYSRLFMS